MKNRTILKTILEPFVIVAAALYFVIDALALSSLKPLLRKIANLKLFKFIASWIASLGPYPTLALFLVPLILLEPVKPLSAYLVASGQFKLGMLVLVVGEILKITFVERLFHIGRDKLMTIKAFAWGYNFVSGWLIWIQALPSWQAVKHSFADFIHWARKLNHDARARECMRHYSGLKPRTAHLATNPNSKRAIGGPINRTGIARKSPELWNPARIP